MKGGGFLVQTKRWRRVMKPTSEHIHRQTGEQLEMYARHFCLNMKITQKGAGKIANGKQPVVHLLNTQQKTSSIDHRDDE